MLTPGRHRLPSSDAYDVETTIAGSIFIARVAVLGSTLFRFFALAWRTGVA